jgi:hypothetical protein
MVDFDFVIVKRLIFLIGMQLSLLLGYYDGYAVHDHRTYEVVERIEPATLAIPNFIT